MAANLQMIDESMYVEESIEIVEFTEGVLLDLVQRLSADQLQALPPLAVPPCSQSAEYRDRATSG